jgi:hypothetical protein
MEKTTTYINSVILNVYFKKFLVQRFSLFKPSFKKPVINKFTDNSKNQQLQKSNQRYNPGLALPFGHAFRQEAGHEPGKVVLHVLPGLFKDAVLMAGVALCGLFLLQLVAHKLSGACLFDEVTGFNRIGQRLAKDASNHQNAEKPAL